MQCYLVLYKSPSLVMATYFAQQNMFREVFYRYIIPENDTGTRYRGKHLVVLHFFCCCSPVFYNMMRSNNPINVKDSDDELALRREGKRRQRLMRVGAGTGSQEQEEDYFGWSDLAGDVHPNVTRERPAVEPTRTAVVREIIREGSAPPDMQRPIVVDENERGSDDDMDDLFDIRVQTLPDGVIPTKDLRCVSCFVRYADVGVFPCGHVSK